MREILNTIAQVGGRVRYLADACMRVAEDFLPRQGKLVVGLIRGGFAVRVLSCSMTLFVGACSMGCSGPADRHSSDSGGAGGASANVGVAGSSGVVASG